MNYTMSVEQIKEAIRDRLAHTFAVSLENATDEEYYKASALIVRELLAKGRSEFVQNAEKTGTKQIYYLCMEFLLGRSLRNNLCNLGPVSYTHLDVYKRQGGGIAPHRPGWGRPPGCLHRAFGGGPLPAAPGAVRPAAAKDRGYAFPRGERSSAPGRGALRCVHPQRPAAGGLGHLAAPAGTAGAHPLPEDAAVL